ncbi:MAG TPA: polyprenyl synthetase family protein [Candidatus Methylomirabilis sp.]|nr:polyprenyl synthetase family protein [Candidatus Methylomirabilis sp.]
MLDPSHVIAELGFQPEVGVMRDAIAGWIGGAEDDIRAVLQWQFQGGSKYFRPLTVWSCYRAIYQGRIPAGLIRSAAVLEMFHNVSLIVDDILDRSQLRRGALTLHAKFGLLPALMASGYIVAEGYRMVASDPHDIGLFSELLRRLGLAECMQWRLRRQPLGVEDWCRIATEDTGTMFEVCACLGTRTEELRRFGRLLGVLYHGCDDVGDVRGAEALGGGGDEDLRDGILTLPAAFAIRDPEIAEIFARPDPSDRDLRTLAKAFRAKLPDAERYLDAIAEEARQEARRFAARPAPLLALVELTRQLSHR